MDDNDRLDTCRAWMQSRHYDALIIPSNDPHFSEYVAAHWQAREWISGFSGSAGTAVITAEKAIVSVDSRYFLQAEKQLAPGFAVLKQRIAHTPEHLEWIIGELSPGAAVAIDGRLCSVNGVADIGARLAQNDIELQLCEDPFAELWSDRPPLPESDLFALDIEYSGVSRKDKLQSLRAELAGRAFLLTALDEIAWLLNLRGGDVQFNPVFYAWLLVEETQAILCCDNSIPQTVREALIADGIALRPYADVGELLDRETLTVHCDCALLPAQLGQNAIDLSSPVALQKAIKNETELANLQQAMLKDARALQAFYSWLKDQGAQQAISEWDCVEQLDACRAQQGNYIGPSFASIVGSRDNGAIVHYHPTAEQCEPVAAGVLLIDSGGQYLEGTTDITRTICIGEPTPEQRTHYTLVLQGLIALSEAEFPRGTTGNQIEVLARRPLWKHGLNYGHGTGHGVGYLLNVHEGPQSFGRGAAAKNIALQPGMLITIEPGYYVPGSHGIRSENMVAVTEAEHEGFLRFTTLTVHPLDTEMIDDSLLDDRERTWLTQYNAHCAVLLGEAAD